MAGQVRTVSGGVGEDVSFAETPVPVADNPQLWSETGNSINLQTFAPGDYKVTLASGKTLSAKVGALPSVQTIDGAWHLSFPPKLGAPATAEFEHLMSWTESADDGVKYFTGTATYRKTVEIPAEDFGAGRKIFLDLGTVKNLATVSLNGKSLGTVWKEPFRVHVTAAARPGANDLEIQVVNLWPNRMIGDQKLPEPQRITWASVTPYKADHALLPSGLIGPVHIVVAQQSVLDRRD